MAIENTLVLAASGALSIGVDDEHVRFVQEDSHGEDANYVAIPRLAFAPVLNQIFKHLDRSDLEEIRLCAEVRLSELAEVSSHG
jgi:hypothetical protein